MNTKFSDLSSKVAAKLLILYFRFMFCSWGDEFPLFSSTPITRKKTLSRLHGSIQVFKKRSRAPPHKWEIGKEPRNSSRRERERRLSSLFVVPCHEPDLSMSFHLCFFFHVHNSNITLPQTFSSISLRSSTKILSFSKRFPFFVSLRFFWHKTLSMFCLQKWTIFGNLPARLKHLSWKTLWRPSARFRWVNINLNCPLFLVGGRFQNWTPGNSRGEELAWSSLSRRKEKANWGGEDPISRIKRNGEQDVPERRQSLHHGALVQRDQHWHSDHRPGLGARLWLPAAFSVCLQVAEIREKN